MITGSLILYDGNIVLNKPVSNNVLFQKPPFESLIRNIIVRNTSLDNWNVVGETRFTIASHDTINKVIVINQTIPDIVINGVEAYGSNFKWSLMRDYASFCLIEKVSGSTNSIYYSYISAVVGQYTVGSIVQFYNPFMNFNFVGTGPCVAMNTGAWNALGLSSMGMWMTESGEYRMIVQGTTSGVIPSLNLVKSVDLNTWTYVNGGGTYMYKGGEGIFSISGVSETYGLAIMGNPIKLATNSYLAYFSSNAGGKGNIGWCKFDENFVVTSTCKAWLDFPGYPPDYVQQVGSAVLQGGVYHLFFVDRQSATQSTWKVMEGIIPDINNPSGVTETRVVLSNVNLDRWNSLHMDAVNPFVWNNKIYLFVFGTGINTANSLYQGNREIGLLIQQDNGSFVVDTRSPIITNPINGSQWGITGCPDHMGGGMGMCFKGNDFHIFCTMNASSNTYQVYHIKIPMV